MVDENEQEIQKIIEYLQSSIERRRGFAAEWLIEKPTGDTRILPFLEALLSDRALYKQSIEPERYTEVRTVAAHAMASERAKLGIQEKLHVTIAPLLTVRDLYELAHQTGIPTNADFVDFYIRLIRAGKAPERAVELDPYDSVWARSERYKAKKQSQDTEDAP